MSNFFNEFQNKWESLSKDVNLINEYTKDHFDVELKNINVYGKEIDGVIFNGATFDSVEFNGVSSKKSIYKKTKFINCKFFNSKYWNSEFVDVEFENCEFISTNFLGSKFLNVKIKNCTAKESEFDDLTGSDVLVENSIFKERSSFTDSKVAFVFRDTTLSGVNMMGLELKQPLLIDGGLLEEVNFGHSHFSTVTLQRVKQGDGPIRFNSITADTLVFDDVDLTRGVGIAYSKVKLVKIVNGRFGAAFEGSTIAKVVARDVYLVNIDFSEATMPSVSMNHCELLDLALWDSTIIELSIMDSSINIANGKNFKGDTVIWDSVTLDGKIDFSNAKIEDFRPTRLKRGPKLNLITTGSNLKF